MSRSGPVRERRPGSSRQPPNRLMSGALGCCRGLAEEAGDAGAVLERDRPEGHRLGQSGEERAEPCGRDEPELALDARPGRAHMRAGPACAGSSGARTARYSGPVFAGRRNRAPREVSSWVSGWPVMCAPRTSRRQPAGPVARRGRGLLAGDEARDVRRDTVGERAREDGDPERPPFSYPGTGTETAARSNGLAKLAKRPSRRLTPSGSARARPRSSDAPARSAGGGRRRRRARPAPRRAGGRAARGRARTRAPGSRGRR